eukprot:Stramenopile-MAST_4_protein_268
MTRICATVVAVLAVVCLLDAVGAAVFWDLAEANITNYEEKTLLYGLQGLVNQLNAPPELFFNTGKENLDFPASDGIWVKYFEEHKNIQFTPAPKATVCDLVSYYKDRFDGTVVYDSDGYSVYIALTIAGLDNVLPVSDALIGNHTCLKEFAVKSDLRGQFSDKFSAYRWAIDTLLSRTSPKLVFNADHYKNAVQSQGAATIMSVDYPIQNKAFIMDLCPLWKCDPIDCGRSGRIPTPRETALFVEVLRSKKELVSVWGWSDPEHAYTNITSHAGGVVFCTFSTPNLSFWRSLSVYLRTKPIQLPVHDLGRRLDDKRVYVMFETNEGDTPRILSSQFTGAWLSEDRGTIPISWALDPFIGTIFPDLYNFYAGNASMNDTFVDGVDGAGYVFLDSLGDHAMAYEIRAGHILSELGPNVVDVGVASNKWPAVTTEELEEYAKNTRRGSGKKRAPSAILNACGTAWNQSMNFWLEDGTPVINSVCVGPPGDTSNGHYLYYYRDYLNQSNPEKDLASRILWAANEYQRKNSPLFMLVFGGLGLYGGNGNIFKFLSTAMGMLNQSRFAVVGAQEMARLAWEAGELPRLPT